MSDYENYDMDGDFQPMEVQPLPTAPHLPDNFFPGQGSMSGADIEALFQSITPQSLSQAQNPYASRHTAGAGPSNYQQHAMSEGDRQSDWSGGVSARSGSVAAQISGGRLKGDVQTNRGLGVDGTPAADRTTLEQAAYANGLQANGYDNDSMEVMEGYSPSPEHKIKRPRAKKQKDPRFTPKRKAPMTEEEKRQRAEEKVQREAERKLISDRKKELKRLAAEEQRANKKAKKLEKKMETGAKTGTKNGSNEKWKGKEGAETTGPQMNVQGMMNGTTSSMGDQTLAYVHSQYGSDDLDSLRSIHDQPEASTSKRPRSENDSASALDGNDTPSRPAKKPKKEKKPPAKKDHLSRPAKQTSGRAMPVRDTLLKEILKGQSTEIQLAPCQRLRYSSYPKCFHCTRKSTGDVCRFRGFRRLPINPDTTEIIGQPFFAAKDGVEDQPPLVTDLNRALQLQDTFRIKKCVASTVIPQITRELRHVTLHKAMTRPLDLDDRATCDFCSVTIFAGSFFCRTCGREYCLDCDAFIAETKEDMRSSRLPLADDARPRMMGCLGRTFHCRPDFIPISRLREADARRHWLALVHFGIDAGLPVMEQLAASGADLADLASEIWARQPVDRTFGLPGELDDHTREMKVSQRRAELDGQFYTEQTSPTQPQDPAGLRCHPFMRLDQSLLDDTTFEALWQKGEPIIVDNLLDRFKEDWRPEAFSERAEQDFLARSNREHFVKPERCTIVDCQTNNTKDIPVQEFFNLITAPKETRGERVWKLKDWPTDCEFRTKFPSLYTDFMEALPVPDFTRRDGAINIACFFPDIKTRPDIGPKMYNAFTGIETVNGLGTTRLHMDMADAINIMLYANEPTLGVAGCAVWDIYRAEDANAIRDFLSVRFKNYKFHDPIHAQIFYMNETIRRELFEEKGVISHRIYQYPGQAVFIPAGCAHQVCNLGDCIKIACDFVSPHNVERCRRLAEEFRGENIRFSWKADVLQYNNTLWYAWLSANTHEKRILHSTFANGDKVSGQSNAGTSSHDMNGHTHTSAIDHTMSLADAAESTARPSDDDPMALVNYVQSQTKLSSGHHVDDEPLKEVPKVDGIELPEKDELAEILLERVLAVPLPPPPTPAIAVVRDVKSEIGIDPMEPPSASSPIPQLVLETNELTPLPASTTTIPDLPTADILPLPISAIDSAPPSALMAVFSDSDIGEDQSSSSRKESHPIIVEEAPPSESNEVNEVSINGHPQSTPHPRTDIHNIYNQAPFLPIPQTLLSSHSLSPLPISNLSDTPLGKGSSPKGSRKEINP